MTIANRFHPTEAVADARAEGRPLVALESTVITHGLPWPDNLEVTRAMCAAVRDAGAEPAVLSIGAGYIRIGMDETLLESFARGDGPPVEKASRRDIGVLLASGGHGALTVAGTVACAALAGIEVFATGGIGGVHRDAPESFDVSADLREIGRREVAVVCAGAKSILDLSRTLEVLETEGVPVVGYGTDRFPAFYVADSGHELGACAVDAEAAAAMIATNRGLGGGMVIANPVPTESALDAADVEAWVADALHAAAGAGIVGKAITPYLLDRLRESSGGRTLDANRALLVHNAGSAAGIAVALAALDAREGRRPAGNACW